MAVDEALPEWKVPPALQLNVLGKVLMERFSVD